MMYPPAYPLPPLNPSMLQYLGLPNPQTHQLLNYPIASPLSPLSNQTGYYDQTSMDILNALRNYAPYFQHQTSMEHPTLDQSTENIPENGLDLSINRNNNSGSQPSMPSTPSFLQGLPWLQNLLPHQLPTNQTPRQPTIPLPLTSNSPQSNSAHQENSPPQSHSTPLSGKADRKRKKAGFQAGVTVAYTYDSFFVSDGRSRRRKKVDMSENSTTLSLPLSSDSSTCTSRVSSPLARSSNAQRYTCNECGRNYATSSNLSRHKQTHRSLDSQQAKRCEYCGKVYVSMPALSMHIMTHTMKHKCHICGKAFSRPWLLQGHLRAHTGEKPFGCAHCGRAFADRSNLRAHMQTHSEKMPFQCPHCKKEFPLKSYLNRHLTNCDKNPNPTYSAETHEHSTKVEVKSVERHPLSVAALVGEC